MTVAFAGFAATLTAAASQPQMPPAGDSSAAPILPAPSQCFGKTIGRVEITSASPSDTKMLQTLTGLHEGDRLERPALQRALRSLVATGRYSSLRAECELSADGNVTVVFKGDPNFFVGRISVEGAPGRPGESQIANASKLQLGELFTAEKMDPTLQYIQRLMQQNGFYKATVSHSEERNAATQQISVLFKIDSGEPARVGKVTFEGTTLMSSGRLEDTGHIHPGDVVNVQTTSGAIERIRRKYQKKDRWLAQVEVADTQFRPANNTLDYTLRIDAGPIVAIEVQGFRLSRGTIRKNIPVYEENALDDDLLNEGRRNLLSYMESRGYFEASVALRRENDKDLVHVVYQIEPGDRHKVVKVEITGNKTFSDQALRPVMQVHEASVLLSRGRYSEALLRSDVRAIENMYRANGYADVKVDTEVKDDYRGAHNEIAVFLHVTEGPLTRVGKFQITGNDTQSADSFPPINSQPGQPFSDANVAQDRDILLNYYFNQGFPSATFDAIATPAPDHHMDVVFHIHEGERVYVNQVLVSGREFTRPYVINRELQMKTGDPLSQSSMLDTQQKLYDIGIFSQVDTAVQNPDGIEPSKNVLVQVREAKRYTFNYGGGFEFQTGQPAGSTQPLGETGVSPLGSFDVTRLNFGGRGHTITFLSRVGRLQQRGLISYEAPQWFNNPNWKLTFTGFFDHTLDVSTFTSQRLEGSVQAAQTINKSSSIAYRFNYRVVKALHVAVNPTQIPILSQPVRLGEPGFGYIRNRRDNDLETTRGTYITVDAGVAASVFGSEADFSRMLVQQSTYHPFAKRRGSTRELVFARSTRVGLENPFASTIITQPGEPFPPNHTQIPLPERFLMGGGNSHRGFGLNQAGPRDPTTGFPLGGAALFLNNLELRFPPPTLPFVQNNMSFAVFHDMGNVFTDGNHMLTGLLRWHQAKGLCMQDIGSVYIPGQGAARCSYDYTSHAIGLGIRYKTPVGPVRFDLGYNLNPTVFPNFVETPDTAHPGSTIMIFQGTKQASPFNVYFSIGQTF